MVLHTKYDEMWPRTIISSLCIINFDKPVKYLGNLQLGDFEHYVGISARLDQGIKSNHSPITLNLGGGPT